MLLSIKKRQEYLKALGFYKGEIDGSAGPLTRKAYRDLQNKYFTRERDRDGYYGKNTDILLRSAYNVRDCKNFRLEEFKCGCHGRYCTGYPAIVDRNLAKNMQKLRNDYGHSINITSGLRCPTFNKRVGGVWNSYHLKGKACDIYMVGVSSSYKNRVELVNKWDTYENSKYAYCNGYMKYKGRKSFPYYSKTMGNATHLNSK